MDNIMILYILLKCNIGENILDILIILGAV